MEPPVGSEVSTWGDVVSCHPGEQRRVMCRLRLHRDPNGRWHIRVSRGAVTGFEGFLIDVRGDWTRLRDGGWCACVGRRGEYDELTFGADELGIALESLGFV